MSLSSRIADLGRRFLDRLELPAAVGRVLVQSLAGVLRSFGGYGRRQQPPRRRGEVRRQLYQLGNRSLAFVLITLAFLGMVMAYQTCLQLSRVTGDFSQVGQQMMRLVIGDFGATLTGMMLATRVGAGIAAELGSMKVTEQLDALRMSGVLPIDYLVVPRLCASVIMTVVLSLLGGLAMLGAAGLTARLSFGVNPYVFFDPSAVTFAHLGVGLVKAASYGVAIPVIASACGLSARGSSEGVGWATTAAVIGGSFAVLALDFAWSTAAYLVFEGRL
jgi:phospholipid/cholesterol/gamma-HCH transport system permease protein